ncbi:MAG: hypothetical protein A2Y12_18860 [Planctomycetes bacterium GWF2_42_9]|nr:MAG: hypothetical protein A2Y12_18860 [Planctomycetes bacterium GWF2_42_9]
MEKNTQSRNKNWKLGFTLVELLVVISIIAVLLSILMPALSKVRKQAQSVVCCTNLKQVGLGMHLYTRANNDTFMKYYGESISEKAWFTRLVKDGKLYSDNIIEYVSGYGVFFCPSYTISPNCYKSAADKKRYPNLRDYQIRQGWIAYGMNARLTDDGGATKPAKITEIKTPANMIMMTDAWHKNDPLMPAFAGGKSLVTGTWFTRGYYNAGIDDVALWHQGAANVLWVDGHVTRVKAPNQKSDSSIYDASALGNYGLANNFWDRK